MNTETRQDSVESVKRKGEYGMDRKRGKWWEDETREKYEGGNPRRKTNWAQDDDYREHKRFQQGMQKPRWDEMTLSTFEKNFYTVHPDVAARTTVRLRHLSIFSCE